MASGSAEHWKSQGNEHFASGRFNDAVGCYTKALEAQHAHPAEGPKPSILLSNRSAAYFRLKQYKNALEDANKACQLDAHWPKAFLRKSTALSALGRDRESLQAIRTAKDLSGDDVDKTLSDEVSACCISYIGAFQLLLSHHSLTQCIPSNLARFSLLLSQANVVSECGC